MYNVGQKVVTRNTTGYIPSQIAFYLQNIHIEPRKIWLTRHAESLDQVRASGREHTVCVVSPTRPNTPLYPHPCEWRQVKHILGRDSGDLTEEGRQYTILLTRFIKAQQERVMVSGTGHEVLILAGTQQVSSRGETGRGEERRGRERLAG